MYLVIFFLLFLLTIFLLFYLYGFIKLFRGNFRKMAEYKVLVNHFKIPENVYKDKTLLWIIALSNSLIISNTGMLIMIFGVENNWNFLILIGLLAGLIFLIYGIVAKILKMKK